MSKITKLLVFGATGTQGHPVVDAGLEAGLEVFAATRNPDDAAEMLSDQSNLIETDLADGDSVADAMAQVDAAFFHLPALPDATQAIEMVQNVISAAQKTWLKRLVFTTGGYCGDDMPPGDFVTGLRMTSAAFLNSGVDTVVLRPTLYLANLVWPHLLREIRERGRLTYPPLSAKRRLNWTSTEDQGRIAVACLHADVVGETLDIASPEPITPPELCQMLAGVFGREVHFAPESIDEFANTLTHMSGSADIGRAISALYAGIDQIPGDGPLVDTDALEKRLNVKLTPVSQWVEERLGALVDLYG